jgi:methyltransferase family protein
MSRVFVSPGVLHRRPTVTPKRILKDLSFRMFLGLDRVGIHLLPKHYYTPVSDYAWLRQHPDLWQRPLSMHGVHWNLEDQFAWLAETCEAYYAEAVHETQRDAIGPGYGKVEAQVLHSFIRKHAPERVVEVGGGTSTAIMAQAAALNAREGRARSRIVTVDPYPAPELHGLDGVEVKPGYGQSVGRSLTDDLRAGDLLFIDSSHALKSSSEVGWLYLEVVPALRPGVIVHVHDVFLPYLYRPTLLKEYFDWQETALLAALLIGNSGLRVLCCQSALHDADPARLAEVLPDCQPGSLSRGLTDSATRGDYPASIWLVRC